MIYIQFGISHRVSAPHSAPAWKPFGVTVLFVGADWTRRTLTTDFPFSGRFEVLAEKYPGNDWEALCSFTFLHDVRYFDLA